MEVTYACPRCDRTVRKAVAKFEEGLCEATVTCDHCSAVRTLPLTPTGHLAHCGVCGGGELYVRKDFSQRLGVMIVVAGFVLSSIAWYFYWVYATFAILFATALIDVVLYLWVGNMLQCYRCQAEYRGVPGLEEHEPFSLETHERYRQQAARLPQG